MKDLWDTVINIEIFAFIGLLLWLYFTPSHLEKAQHPQSASDSDTTQD